MPGDRKADAVRKAESLRLAERALIGPALRMAAAIYLVDECKTTSRVLAYCKALAEMREAAMHLWRTAGGSTSRAASRRKAKKGKR